MIATQVKPVEAAFAERFVQILNDAGVALMISLGHRSGLFDALARLHDGGTSAELAHEAGLNERYVREWLGAMLTGGIVEYDVPTERYRLPPEHAAWLTRLASPNNLAINAQWIAVLGSVENHVLEAFVHGRGVPYEVYHDFHRVMAEESAQTTVAALDEHILPLVPGLVDQLEEGSSVLDVGCGAGMALCHLASRFPRSTFTGYDFSPEAIVRAREEALQRGLQNIWFAVRDVEAFDEPGKYDWITAFDAIHDQRHPDRVLANIRRALKDGGVFLMQDIAASSRPHLNVGGNPPLAPFVYTISCMHCMSVALQDGGMGLGAAWGREKALEMLQQAGFGEVRVEQLQHDIMNYYYVAKG